MKNIKSFVKGHAVSIYFILTFVISWGSILLVIGGPGGIPGTPEQLKSLFPMAITGMLAGPSVAGMLLTGLVCGRAGFRELTSRLLKWRVGWHWYAVAILFAPLYMAAALLALSLISPVFIPSIFASGNRVSLLLSGIGAGLMVGIFEELGWTGFAIPRLRLRYGVVTTGLTVGVLWGAWHVLTNGLWASGTASGALSVAIFLPVYIFTFLVGQLVAFRVLMVWVYDRTGSLLLAMLMHASLTAFTLILGAPATGGALLVLCLAYAAAAWVVVAVVALANRGHLTRRAPQK
jgi:membrane protease YdiL (CAAX protease family)